jgi:hypothetical protein
MFEIKFQVLQLWEFISDKFDASWMTYFQFQTLHFLKDGTKTAKVATRDDAKGAIDR